MAFSGFFVYRITHTCSVPSSVFLRKAVGLYIYILSIYSERAVVKAAPETAVYSLICWTDVACPSPTPENATPPPVSRYVKDRSGRLEWMGVATRPAAHFSKSKKKN